MVFDVKWNKIVLDDSNVNVRLVVSKWLEEDLSYLASKISTEFAFYLANYEVRQYRDTTFFIIPHQEIIIPKQRASSAEVEITESMPYPINGHKHPRGVTTFSTVDLEYITNNADISLLVTEDGIQEATVRIISDLKMLGETMILIRMRNILRMFDEPKNYDMDAKVREIKEKLETPKYPIYTTVDNVINGLTDDIFYYYEDDITATTKKKKKGGFK